LSSPLQPLQFKLTPLFICIVIYQSIKKQMENHGCLSAHNKATTQPVVEAETIVDLGIDWNGTISLSDLQTGLIAALQTLDLRITRGVK
jgi:hypothetical protein